MAYSRGQSNAKGGGRLAETLQFHRIIDSQTEQMPTYVGFCSIHTSCVKL